MGIGIIVRKCSDLLYRDGTHIIQNPFNGSDSFENIIGITLFGGYLYVLDYNIGAGIHRIIRFSANDLSYVDQTTLASMTGYVADGIDNDGTHVFITTRWGGPV